MTQGKSQESRSGRGLRAIQWALASAFLLSSYHVQADWSALNMTKGVTEISEKVYDLHMLIFTCLLYTSPSPRDRQKSRMPSSA